ncbi:3-hydroxyacyl-CoA dehydrogenase [Frigoribacterium sp. CFBP 13729]|uniref:Rv3235 family protein n=1 Tax=Frigoribacterium sp. CFBP 13729 TaxID=2775293 RepID=UPI0017812166|nr:Rv3235 family protein [Frigoribacterium sp. CFBP 13729]MBD8609663.1 3-hydroxyacyl-CoA dehydrogenase [Frigoribacterium sp. CFBP 13729]
MTLPLALLSSEPDEPRGLDEPERRTDGPHRPAELFLVEPLPPEPLPPEQTAPPEPELDPGLAAEGLARSVLEVLAGARDLQQLTRWVTAEVHAVLRARVQLSTRARSVIADRPVRPVLRIGTVKVARPVPGVAETVVVVHGRGRARAVAIRLEIVGGRWQASALHIL